MADESLVLFAVLSIGTIVSALAIFAEKSVFKSALALAITLFLVSMAFVLLGQPVLAVIQLFVLVGGLSTYTIVAVASETRSHQYRLGIRTAVIVFVVVFAVMSAAILPSILQFTTPGASFYQASAEALTYYGPAIYISVIFMFSVSAGSIIIIKRYIKG